MVFKTREILEHIIYTRKITYKYQGNSNRSKYYTLKSDSITKSWGQKSSAQPSQPGSNKHHQLRCVRGSSGLGRNSNFPPALWIMEG